MDINVGTRCEPFCEGNYGSEKLRERMGMDKKLTVTVGDGEALYPPILALPLLPFLMGVRGITPENA